MKLEIIYTSDFMDNILEQIDQHFNVTMKTFRSQMSMFEQYEIRPAQRVFVPRIWTYRIIAQNGKYYFGTL